MVKWWEISHYYALPVLLQFFCSTFSSKSQCGNLVEKCGNLGVELRLRPQTVPDFPECTMLMSEILHVENDGSPSFSFFFLFLPHSWCGNAAECIRWCSEFEITWSYCTLFPDPLVIYLYFSYLFIYAFFFSFSSSSTYCLWWAVRAHCCHLMTHGIKSWGFQRNR